MKKNISYREQLSELSKLYKIDEINNYIKSKKNLTTAQIELILLKNKVRLPEQSYNKKRIAAIRFKEQVITNLVVTICFLFFNTFAMYEKILLELIMQLDMILI